MILCQLQLARRRWKTIKRARQYEVIDLTKERNAKDKTKENEVTDLCDTEVKVCETGAFHMGKHRQQRRAVLLKGHKTTVGMKGSQLACNKKDNEVPSRRKRQRQEELQGDNGIEHSKMAKLDDQQAALSDADNESVQVMEFRTSKLPVFRVGQPPKHRRKLLL